MQVAEGGPEDDQPQEQGPNPPRDSRASRRMVEVTVVLVDPANASAVDHAEGEVVAASTEASAMSRPAEVDVDMEAGSKQARAHPESSELASPEDGVKSPKLVQVAISEHMEDKWLAEAGSVHGSQIFASGSDSSNSRSRRRSGEVTLESSFSKRNEEVRKVHVLWFAAGPSLGAVCSILSYGVLAYGNPIQLDTWWHCMIPCVTMWVGLFMACITANIYTLVLRPQRKSWRTRGLKGSPLEWRAYLLRGLTIIYSVAALIMLAIWYLLTLFGRHPVWFHGAWAAGIGSTVGIVVSFWACVHPDLRAYPAVRREVAFVTLFNVSLLPTMICCWGLAVVYRLTLPVHPLLTIFVGSFFCVLRTGAEEMCERLLHRVPTAGNSRFALVDIMIVTNHITYLATILGASPEYVTSSIAFIDALSLASLVPYITGQTRVPVSDWLRWKLSGHKTERWGIGFSLRSAAQTRTLLRMLTAEVLELSIPIFYSAAYAYLRWVGPNAKWMTGVGVQAFGLEVPTLEDFAGSMAAMITIDLLLVIATFQYVNRKCYVDCFTMVAGVGYEYQIALVVACAFLTYHQFCVTLVHCGMDFSFGQEDGHQLYIMGAEEWHNRSHVQQQWING